MVSQNAKTAFYFLLGNPVAHSLSPLIYNAGFQALGINAVYLAAPVEPGELDAAVKGLRALTAGGGNVTSPYKEAVIPNLDILSEEARAISSVNTIVKQKGNLCGHSTDGEGFYQALMNALPGFDLSSPTLLIGTGGSARAVAYTLAQKGLQELYLVNRSPDKADYLAGLIRKKTPLKKCHPLPLSRNSVNEALSECRLIVYCLPLDAEEVTAAINLKDLDYREKIFFDLRYSPAETVVMKKIAHAGAKTFNGSGLLLRQALIAFELFTGLDAPLEAMESALKCYLLKEKQNGSI